MKNIEKVTQIPTQNQLKVEERERTPQKQRRDKTTDNTVTMG